MGHVTLWCYYGKWSSNTGSCVHVFGTDWLMYSVPYQPHNPSPADHALVHAVIMATSYPIAPSPKSTCMIVHVHVHACTGAACRRASDENNT